MTNLSARHREIIRLVAAGMSNREIAAMTSLKEPSIKNYLTIIYRRVGVRDRVRLLLWAQEHRL